LAGRTLGKRADVVKHKALLPQRPVNADFARHWARHREANKPPRKKKRSVRGFILEKLGLSHRASLMEKLSIHETAGLVRYAIRIGLIQP
jgi:hypothetical protein